MISGVKEQIELPGGQAYRVLRWKENLHDVESVLSRHRSIRIGGEGDHWHYHQAYELTLFSAGEGTRFVGDQIAPFERGDLVLLGENLPHHWRTRGVSAGISVQWFFPAGHPLWAFPEADTLPAYFKTAARGIHFRGPTASLLSAQLHQLVATEGLDRLGFLLRIFATAAAAPSRDYTFLSAHAFSLSAETRHQTAMRAAVQFLLAHFRDDVRMEQLLKVTRMSKPTFSRQFKKHAGKTLNEFLQQVRLDAACSELTETDHPIIDVALRSGFSQISFFNRIFRRMLKCSPSAYRTRSRRRTT